MSKVRSFPSSILLYLGVMGTLVLGMGYGASSILSGAEGAMEWQHAKSLLDERVATAREIKRILSVPQAKVEPLPPITAKLANSSSSAAKVAVSAQADKPKRTKLSRDALNAMAMATGADSPPPRSTLVFDRGGIGGW